MPTPTPGGDWRHNQKGSGPQPSGTTPSGASRRPWQPGASGVQKPTKKRKSRVGMFLLSAVGTGVLIGLIVFVIWLIRPPKYPNLIVVAPNPAGLLAIEENTGGAHGAAGLLEWAAGDKKDRPRPAVPTAITDRDGWKAHLEATRGPLVLAFAAHGGADRDGPFLWVVPSDARGPADAHKLRVKEILDRLAGLPKDQPKLLVFDAAAVHASWPHGMIFNDFARALKELDADIAAVDGLAVICSSDADQRAWVSDEWRESVFSHYLREAISGAGGRPGDRITAAAVFDSASDATGRWALANRDEKQTPILLPADSGKDRAARVELASVPPSGYVKPADPELPGPPPADLVAAWDAAWQLANRTPAPDTTDPLRWREYLALLDRWQRLVRVGGDPQDVKGRAAVLAAQLGEVYGSAEPVGLAVAVPVGRALGLPPTQFDSDGFRKLWSPPPGSTATDEWAKQNKTATAHRVAVARQVIEQAYENPTPATLKTADELLQVIDGSPFLPAEAHFVRMLARNLDARRPDADLLKNAISLRRDAEEVAWVGGADAAVYPYAEQVFRWTRGSVEAGDRARQLGQDLLFDSDPKGKSWAEAAGHFATARKEYDRAKADAQAVAAALAARDAAFARLPYYARWAAGYRGKRSAAEVDALLTRVEEAARAAHQIAAGAADVPDDPAARDRRAKELVGLTTQFREAFDEVEKAFRSEAESLGNVVHPSNWHALDNALTVPFLPARDRERLFKALRHVSARLASEPDRPAGGTAATLAQELAKRQGRMAVAILGDTSPELAQLVMQPELGAWWKSYREAGTRIGQRFQKLADDVKEASAKAAGAATLREAAPHLAHAAYLARLADPAAPPRVQDETPPAAEQRYWRHYMLLWQAARVTTEGWAEVAPGPADQWYCRKAARRLIDSAEELVNVRDPNLSPAERDRRLADARAERNRNPVELTLSAEKAVDVADDPQWKFAFTLGRPANAPVGYPVYWLTPPGEPYARPDPDLAGRHREARLAEPGAPAQVKSAEFSFDPVPKAGEVPAAGRLATTVFYRGHRYEARTDVWLAGAPTLDWNYNPPPRDAPGSFVVLADRGAVAGAVTLLIDLSGSMTEKLPGGTLSRIQATFDALEQVLRELPRNTTLTVAFFWGTGQEQVNVQPLAEATRLVWRQEELQIRDVMTAARKLKPDPPNTTPLYRSVRRILDTDQKTYWPAAASGVRTLVVLTDGADNFDANAGALIQKELLEGNELVETEFHLIFFGLDAENEKLTRAQYRPLLDKDPFLSKRRTPPEIWWDVNGVRSLADRLRAAVLPRVYYWREETAGNVARQTGWLPVSLPTEEQYVASPPLAPGAYHLRGTRNPQRLQLLPGDRVVLRADGTGQGKFDLTVPPYAFQYAERANLPRDTGKAGASGIHLTLPSLGIQEETGHYDLKLLATMEPLGGMPARDLLLAPRPLFAWFDVDYADKKGGAAGGLHPTLRVYNRPGLRAPAWDVEVARYDVNRARDAARLPAVTGYWVEQLPGVAGKYAVDLRNPGQTKPLAASQAELVGVNIERVEKGDGSRLPPGDYLTVRMKYRPRTERVFVRPGALKGAAQPLVLHERHLYFDREEAGASADRAARPGRYTARFGPLDPADLNAVVELEVYPVAAFKELAGKTGRRAAVTLPKMQPAVLPPQLQLLPAKE